MTPRDHQILDLFSSRVRALFPDARIWAFGSRARGTATEESDLDLCVVIEMRTETAVEQISHIAWEVGFDNDTLITTVVYARQEFETGLQSFSPLVRVIRKEGILA